MRSPEDVAGQDALALRARTGDPEAVGDWYGAESGPVFRLCLGLLADDAEAEDAAQDAMTHLLDHLQDWDARRPYRTWRNTVVSNLCRDRRRRRVSRRRAEGSAAELRPPTPLPHPEDEARRSEVRSLLVGALRALSPREREVFVLRDLEGVPTDETAGALGITEGTVRSLLSLARRRLRQLLGERLPDATA